MTLEEFLNKYLNSNMKIYDIEDNTIRQIKIKYFNKIHSVVEDEYNIKDKDLLQVYEQLKEEEKKELEEYYNSVN